MIATLLLLGAGGALVWALTQNTGERTSARRMVLVNGKRYAVAHNLTAPPLTVDGSDIASMYTSMGFCNVQGLQPIFNDKGQMIQVQFVANWCMKNTNWDVPATVAISEY